MVCIGLSQDDKPFQSFHRTGEDKLFNTILLGKDTVVTSALDKNQPFQKLLLLKIKSARTSPFRGSCFTYR